jgi:hypothetical protein
MACRAVAGDQLGFDRDFLRTRSAGQGKTGDHGRRNDYMTKFVKSLHANLPFQFLN